MATTNKKIIDLDGLSHYNDKVKTKIETVKGDLELAIGNEETARTNADNGLSTAITNEQTMRTNADNNLQSQISSLASGAPIPVASTSQMSDHSKIYVNTTDGNWYYWSTGGSAWTVGGVYQATGIADGSVSGTSLYDGTPTPKYTYTQNYFWGNGGNKTYLDTWECCEEFFPVQAGDTITVTNVIASAIAVWDSDKEFIQLINVGNDVIDYTNTFTDPDMAYITLSFRKGYTHQMTINNVEVLNRWSVDWLNIKSDNLDFSPDGLSGSLLKDDSISHAKLVLDNGEPVTNGSFWSDAPTHPPYIVDNSNWSRFTNLISVEIGDAIQAKNVRGAWLIKFDSNEDAIGHEDVGSTITNASYVVASGVSKIGLNIYNSNIEEVEFYINGEKIYFDNTERFTIDWLKLNDEQKASVGGDVDRFADYKTLFIGDSITEHNYRASQNWVDYITSELKITNYLNGGMSGTGILKSFNSYPNWIDKLPTYSNDYNMILIMGDMNDWSNKLFTESNLGQYGDSTTDTFYGAMKVYLEMLLTKYPLGKIGWITSTPRNKQITGTSDYLHGQTSIFEKASEIIREMCANYSIPVLDLYNESSLYPWIADNNTYYFKPDEGEYSADAIHPNSKGQRVMAYKIKDFIIRNF